ncbi:MAG: GNAT family N-acetyltransferase [Anaerolineales bacterium]|nr:GNAT family N-acetyltransferase [Anaerolineales bacterium]
MPEIQIRPAVAADIAVLVAIDHSYVSDHVWQLEVRQEGGSKPTDLQIDVIFRQLQLPRSVRVDYPRRPEALIDDWKKRSGLLVAIYQEQVVGYVGMMTNIAPLTTWVTDLAVTRRMRRQGMGSALILAAQEWARHKASYRIVLEMQPKNYPAICLAMKMGFALCGYNDRYYANHDIALFFARSVRQ